MSGVIGNPGFWLYLAAWLPYTLIVFYYGFGSPWWQTPIGRAFWFSKVALSLVLGFALSVLIFGRYSWLPEIRTAMMTLVILAAWYQFWAVRSLQRESRANPTEHPRRRKGDA